MLGTNFPIAIAALVAIVATPTVKATQHTLCFNYFMQKDGCVFSSANPHTRCAPDGHPPKNGVGMLQQHAFQRREEHTLEPRYDTPKGSKSFFVASGTGVCGFYDGDKPGACIWNGAKDQFGNGLGGWLNGSKTSNCHKNLYIMRRGNPQSVVYVPVVDGCNFNVKNPDNGCFQIGVTRATFFALNPSEQEKNQGYLTDLTWDFDNLSGQHSRNGPV
ncbi:secreted protein [Melampsora americana]|nr:secreted protein [Melampsora americana]